MRRKEAATSNHITQTEALNWLIRRTARVEDKLNRLLERNEKLMGIAQDTLEKARATKTVSESTNVAVKEVIRLLKQNQQNPEDTAALTEAMAILDGIQADDNAVLTENTPEEPA